jgi:hypothetical protein
MVPPHLFPRPLAGTALVAILLVGCGSPPDGSRSDRGGAPGDDARTASAATVTQEAAGGPGSRAARPLPGRAWVVFGADTVEAEVARTAEEREQGLMFRESLAQGSGMLFVFEESAPRSFWMKDTYIPLDIAYMDESFRIVDIQQMTPEDTRTYDSAAPAMFALEVPVGWFSNHGIEVGDVAQVVFN